MKKHTPKRNSEERKIMLRERRERQLARVPDLDARLVYFSKNSLSEYQVKYIRNRIRDLDIFLSGDPRKGGINAHLEKQWLEQLLNINKA